MTDRRFASRRRPAAILILLASITACVRFHPYASLTEAAEPLRTQFNQDAGYVRIMMLVAPT